MNRNIWKEFSEVSKGAIERMCSVGILLNSISADKGKANTMTIGWGMLGSLWNKPVFQIFVRPQRYTFELLEQTKEFTISISKSNFQDGILYAGTYSGRDADKFKELGVTLVDSEKISVPYIKEFDVSIECKVIYQDCLKPELIPEDVKKTFYPGNDFHKFYIGEVLAVHKK